MFDTETTGSDPETATIAVAVAPEGAGGPVVVVPPWHVQHLSDLDLLAGYVRHVARCRLATNAYTLADTRRVGRYAVFANLTHEQHTRLADLVSDLASREAPR